MKLDGSPLVATLRSWRLEEARRRRVPAFRVLTNRTLMELVTARPQSEAALRAVKGMGPKLLKSYGQTLLGLIRDG